MKYFRVKSVDGIIDMRIILYSDSLIEIHDIVTWCVEDTKYRQKGEWKTDADKSGKGSKEGWN